MHRHLSKITTHAPLEYVAIRADVFTCRALSPLAMAVYGWLTVWNARHAGRTEFPFADDGAFDAALDELVAAGFIDLVPLGDPDAVDTPYGVILRGFPR